MAKHEGSTVWLWQSRRKRKREEGGEILEGERERGPGGGCGAERWVFSSNSLEVKIDRRRSRCLRRQRFAW